MTDLFFAGNPLLMGILTLLFIAMAVWMIYTFVTRQNMPEAKYIRYLQMGKSIGLFALIVGILFQLIGFYMALSQMEKVVDISPGVLYGGLKYSMITTIYGLIIFLVSQALGFIMSLKTT